MEKKPLEAAYTPCMDTLLHKGMTGLMDLFSPGIPVGTDVGHICIFGYHPEDVYSGRGPIEAVGAGVRLYAGVIKYFSEPLIVAIGSDHSTPCNLGEHSGDSVPILLSGLGLRSDSTSVYNELAAMDGGLGHVSGKDFLHIVLNAGNYMSKIGV